jgi:hypothetical protein
MSGGKACGKQAAQYAGKQPDEGSVVTRRDTTAPDIEEHPSGRTRRKSMRLKELADALRQGLPHLSDPASLQGSRAGKQPEGTGTTEKGKQLAAQKKTTCTTRPATLTQPLLLAADAFAAAPAAEPEWCKLWEPFLQNTNEQGIWPACRTIMLGRTSKRVKKVVDKMRLPAVVRLSRSFRDARNGTKRAKLQFVFMQLAAITARCRITTLELLRCDMKGQDVERFAGVLAQCPALAHLDLSGNSDFGAAGAERLAGVLGQCRELVHLNLSGNDIGAGGTERLAGVLPQCPALAHLNLFYNRIGPAGAERLAGVLPQCPALVHLNLSYNWIGPAGAERLAGVLGQCAALVHLDLYGNQIEAAGAESLAGVLAKSTALARLDLCGNGIGPAGAESLAGVLAQCPALAHLNLRANDIGADGAESLAGVLAYCAALAHLDLSFNHIGTVGEGRLRASWCGQASGLRL